MYFILFFLIFLFFLFLKNIIKTTKLKNTKPNKKSSKQKHKCRTFKKTKPAPGCDGNEECVWIPNIGCLENDEEVIKHEKEKKRHKRGGPEKYILNTLKFI